jgi:hypothetical protein
VHPYVPESNIANWVSIEDLLTNPFSGFFYNLELRRPTGTLTAVKVLWDKVKKKIEERPVIYFSVHIY